MITPSSRNPLIEGPLLLAENFRHFLFTDGFSSHYRPIQNVSFLLDYLVWKEQLQRGGRAEEARAAMAEFNRLQVMTSRPAQGLACGTRNGR
jgi:hypothetical protein